MTISHRDFPPSGHERVPRIVITSKMIQEMGKTMLGNLLLETVLLHYSINDISERSDVSQEKIVEYIEVFLKKYPNLTSFRNSGRLNEASLIFAANQSKYKGIDDALLAFQKIVYGRQGENEYREIEKKFTPDIDAFTDRVARDKQLCGILAEAIFNDFNKRTEFFTNESKVRDRLWAFHEKFKNDLDLFETSGFSGFSARVFLDALTPFSKKREYEMAIEEFEDAMFGRHADRAN